MVVIFHVKICLITGRIRPAIAGTYHLAVILLVGNFCMWKSRTKARIFLNAPPCNDSLTRALNS